ncbi:MAG: hypothetical protein IPO66_22800 [Rhodanobacteraceae bacterium]|nr:hypothetical protein [Rhodanobacteraceae bacterium]
MIRAQLETGWKFAIDVTAASSTRALRQLEEALRGEGIPGAHRRVIPRPPTHMLRDLDAQLKDGATLLVNA